jgi:tetratricopeptide (TPR) repeat protein
LLSSPADSGPGEEQVDLRTSCDRYLRILDGNIIYVHIAPQLAKLRQKIAVPCDAAVDRIVANNMIASQEKQEYLGSLGISIDWLQTGFMEEVQAAEELSTVDGFPFETTATVYDIEPQVICSKGADTICPVDGRLGSSYVHALLELQKKQEIPPDVVGPANYMLSYGWGYKVKDIVDTLADFCETNSLDPKTTYVWICCLCNNQHRVQERLKTGETVPFEEFRQVFYNNVTTIKNILAMMAPWNKPYYLTRVWCIFELFTASTNPDCNLTILMPPEEKKALEQQLLSQHGKGIDALFETLAATKVENASASIEADKEAILKLIQEQGEGAYDTLNHGVNELLRKWVVQVISSVAAEWDTNKNANQSERAADMFLFIGKTLDHIGYLDDALVEFRKALAIHLKVHGDQHPSTAISYNNIGSVLKSQGNYEDALVEYRKALAIKLQVYGDQHPDTAISYNNIGLVLYDQGNYEDALVEYRKALAIQLQVYGDQHPDTATSYNNIGLVLNDQGHYEDALVEYRKALAIDLKVHGDQHPALPLPTTILDLFCLSQGHYEDALVEYRKALAIQLQVYGDQHPDTATSYNNIGLVLSDQGNYEDALVEYRKALAIRLKVYGDQHPDTAISYNNIGVVLKNQGHYEDALVEYRKALAIRSQSPWRPTPRHSRCPKEYSQLFGASYTLAS